MARLKEITIFYNINPKTTCRGYKRYKIRDTITNIRESANQGRRLRGDRGIVPLKKLGGGDGGAFIPPIFRKCLTNLQCKKG